MNTARSLSTLVLLPLLTLAVIAPTMAQTPAATAESPVDNPVDMPPKPDFSPPQDIDAVDDVVEAEDDFAALYGSSNAANGDSAVYDPWERYNRSVHRFNLAIDRTIAQPLATTYVKVVPQFARTGVRNFFSNLRSPVTMVNQVLQGRPGHAWDTLGRFLINTTVGVGGLFDPASVDDVPKRDEDFGQTLGVWGWKQSRYLELPFFGPRTVRDVVGLAGDIPLSPTRQIDNDRVRIGLQGLQLVDTRVKYLAVDGLRDTAVDEYAMTRDAWLQRRSYQINENARNVDDHLVPTDAIPMLDFSK